MFVIRFFEATIGLMVVLGIVLVSVAELSHNRVTDGVVYKALVKEISIISQSH